MGIGLRILGFGFVDDRLQGDSTSALASGVGAGEGFRIWIRGLGFFGF